MTIMHIFVVADAKQTGPVGAQLRYHKAVPWDETQELYLDPNALDAIFALAIAARGGDASTPLRGRVFDVLRTMREAQPTHVFQGRDAGPYVAVTDSGVFHRMELESLLSTWTDDQWSAALQRGRHINFLLARAADRI